MKIRLRLTLSYTGILLLTLLVFNGVVYIGLQQNLQTSLDNHLQQEAEQILGGLEIESHKEEEAHHQENAADHLFLRDNLELDYTPVTGIFWRVLDKTGDPLADHYFEDVVLSEEVLAPDTFSYQRLNNGSILRLYTSPPRIKDGVTAIIQVAESYQPLQETQQRLFWWLTGSLPFILVIAGVSGWWLAGRGLDPIEEITEKVRWITASDLDQRLTLNLPDDEVGRLAKTFNDMFNRLQTAFEQQKRLIADTSHEMRTPLTILKGDIEVALNRPRTPQYYRETLEMADGTVDHLVRLIEALLFLAKAESYQYRLRYEHVNLTDLLQTQINRLGRLAADKNMNLQLRPLEPITVQADSTVLGLVFLNLLENAIKYGRHQTVVTAIISQSPGEVWIKVIDNGPGIPPEHIPHLFDRFYRVDKSRNHDVEATVNGSGAGLGLSIVKWAIEMHGGTVKVDSEPNKGTTFTVFIPQPLMSKVSDKPGPVSSQATFINDF